MESFCIEGGIPLRGEITPSGNKNAALPLLCATILTDEPVILHNVPMIRDVLAMRKLIESLGVTFEEVDPHTWKIQAKNVEPAKLDPDMCRRARASILLAGPMCARCGGLVLEQDRHGHHCRQRPGERRHLRRRVPDDSLDIYSFITT